MAELLKANLVAHLSFYRRSRLLLAFLILFAVLTALATVPQFFVDSGVQNFNLPETPVVDFSAFYRAFDPTHSKETQGYGPAFTESTATAISHSGVVSLQSGIYCATLSTFVGDDSHGTSVVCYDASLGRGHWFDAISGTAGPDTGGWGRSGVITATCATPYCNPLLIYIKAVHLNFGLTPYLKLDMGNHAYWDMRGLNFTMIYPSVSERMGSDRVISDSSNQFFTWPLVDYSNRTAVTFPPPNSWSKPSNYENKVVYPGGLYYNSNQITFTGPGDPGVAFISASNKNRVTPCVHDVGGTCGIYGVALDGSGTEYSFFPHFASMQQRRNSRHGEVQLIGLYRLSRIYLDLLGQRLDGKTRLLRRSDSFQLLGSRQAKSRRRFRRSGAVTDGC